MGSGSNVPLKHKALFPYQTQLLDQQNLSEGSVADLIDNINHVWKPNLVRSLYWPKWPNGHKILTI